MATLAEIRAQHPEYNDLSDVALANGIYTKFYSDMPREQFDAKIGLQPVPGENALGASTRGISNVLPGGTYMDEAVAGAAATLDPLTSLITGKDQGATWTDRYNRHLANQRAEAQQAAQLHRTAETVGNVAGIAAVAPKAVAGLAAPIMRAATTGERLINAGVAAAEGGAGAGVYGAVQGFGEGQGGFQPRLAEAGREAALGIKTGVVLGAGLGGMARMPTVTPSAVAQAADRSGVYVPEALASDIPAVQQAGGAAKSIPVFGTRIAEAGKRTAAEFAGEKARIAEEFGGGAAATPSSAGQEARDALENWAGPLTKGVLSNEYGVVDRLINPAITTPLNETARTAAQIVARNRAATLPPGSAVGIIRQAASTPAGLTYDGIKNLRTHIGEMLDTPSLIPAETSQAELKQIYGALTKDLRAATQNAGGIAARQAFDRANLLNARVQTRRTELMRILGVNPNNPTSAETIFAAIQRKAGSKSTADIATVNKIRKTMPADVWDQVASGVVGELGRSAAVPGEVSLDRFFTNYNQLSDAGKAALFGNRPDLKTALDDLATIAGRGKEVAKWANPSGTAQHGAILTLGAALGHPALWPKIAASALGAHFLTRALTRPASVRALGAWARVWQANQIKRATRAGVQSSGLEHSLRFVSRQLAVNVGREFGLAADRVRQIAASLEGDIPVQAGPSEPDQKK